MGGRKGSSALPCAVPAPSPPPALLHVLRLPSIATRPSALRWPRAPHGQLASRPRALRKLGSGCKSAQRARERSATSKQAWLVQVVPLGACHPRRGCDRVLRRMRSCSSQYCCLAAAASCCHPRVWAVLASIGACACTGRGIRGLIGPRCWMQRGRATERNQGLRRMGVGGRGAVLVGGKGAVLVGLALPRGEARRGLGTVGRVSAMTSGCP